jgi:5-methyltetrahydrofolate--homocysteine methyltransferase
MTSAQLRDMLAAEKVVPLDGAWGTELAQRGLPAGEVPETWNMTHASDVASVPKAYIEAGARVVLTNTFGGSRFKLDKAGLAGGVRAINEAGARISREAAGKAALVFGSVGPTGEFLEPLGSVTTAQMTETFEEQIGALVTGGVDAIVVETMTDLEEAICGLRAARRVAPQMPVAVSLTFSKGARGYATMMGVTPKAAAARLAEEGADIIGTNCGNGMDNMIEIVAELRATTTAPIWARPNAGMPRLVNGVTIFPETPDEMVVKIPALLNAGACMIGGCCGTTPAHIAAFVAKMRSCA